MKPKKEKKPTELERLRARNLELEETNAHLVSLGSSKEREVTQWRKNYEDQREKYERQREALDRKSHDLEMERRERAHVNAMLIHLSNALTQITKMKDGLSDYDPCPF